MLAQEEARRLGHNFVGTEQILLGLIGESTGIAAKVLKSMSVNLKDARVEVEKIIGAPRLPHSLLWKHLAGLCKFALLSCPSRPTFTSCSCLLPFCHSVTSHSCRPWQRICGCRDPLHTSRQEGA